MLILTWCWGIIYPWRRDAKGPAGLRWASHVLLGIGLVAGLWYLNRWGGLERILRSPWPMLHRFWLPMLAVALYGLGWLGRGLWLSLARDPLPGLSPDVNAAWNETRSALEKANIDLRTTPMFLILGPLTSDLRTLLASLGTSPMRLRVNAPFQVFACREGVFVVCDSAKGEAAADRLRHLCQTLAYERSPILPIQGIMLIVAFGPRAVNEAQVDLRIVRQATGIEVPVYVAVSGAEVQAGALWFQQFPPMPDLDPAEVPTMYRDGIDWLCLERMATDVRSQFRLDLAATEPGKLPQALRENIRLYQSQRAIQAWRGRLKELLVEGMQNDYSEAGMVAGCYFLPGGEAKSLAAALWGDLLAYQHTATWTADTIARHEAQRRRAWIGYGLGVLGVGACMSAALGSFLLGRL